MRVKLTICGRHFVDEGLSTSNCSELYTSAQITEMYRWSEVIGDISESYHSIKIFVL